MSGTTIIAQIFVLNTNFQRKIVDIFLPIIFSIRFWCLKGLSH